MRKRYFSNAAQANYLFYEYTPRAVIRVIPSVVTLPPPEAVVGVIKVTAEVITVG